MNSKLVLIGIVAAAAVLAAVPVVAQQGDDQAAMMEAWQKAATPGDAHKGMAAMAGTWSISSKMWMDPSQDPVVTTGTSKKSMVLGGRFLKEEMKASMMGMEMDGISFTGSNNTTGNCEFMWIDNMGTMMMTGTGSMEGNSMTLMSTFVDPMTGEETTVRMTTEIQDENTHVFSMYSMIEGKEVKTMEATYTRAE